MFVYIYVHGFYFKLFINGMLHYAQQNPIYRDFQRPSLTPDSS